MAGKVKIWFDAEADYLEVQFREGAGYMKGTARDAVMERVDEEGAIIGFSILGVSRFKKDVWKLICTGRESDAPRR